VLPGTSLAGALRARALRIANTLTQDEVKAQAAIDALFGVGPEGAARTEHWASRLIVHESLVKRVNTLVQNRIRVDRFTGGAMDNYLFNEAPVFGDKDSRLTLELTLRSPKAYEIGLLLLLLKDLWTGDLPLGGESSVGRGRLSGLSAKLTRAENGNTTTWTIDRAEDGLKVTADPPVADAARSLEAFVQALSDHLAGR
jgi:CRISPR/Cas system CSM-associated protein Csm3 (group 7 of RAMP superfamily)